MWDKERVPSGICCVQYSIFNIQGSRNSRAESQIIHRKTLHYVYTEIMHIGADAYNGRPLYSSGFVQRLCNIQCCR